MNPRKDPLFVSLIIVLFCLIVVGGYYYGRHRLSMWINGEPLNTSVVTKTKNSLSENTTVTMSGMPADSGQFLDASDNIGSRNSKTTTGNTANNTNTQTPAGPQQLNENIVSLVPRTDTPEFGKSIKAITSSSTDNSDDEDESKLTIESVSDIPDVVCQLKTGKSQKLSVYPSRSGWRSIYLIAPITDRKMLSRKNLIQPDFEGVSYPIYKAAKLSFKGKKYDVIHITFQSTSVDAKHPYSILLQSNPSFVIFGEQKSSDIYVFENGRVSKFTPTADNFNLTDN
ncbi:MAG: hypothetical protein J0H46_13250 [Bacteroidetes bacterium]|nr:hypothetical protein [Bacteroidota bacterium]